MSDYSIVEKTVNISVNRKFKNPCKSLIYKGSHFKIVVPRALKESLCNFLIARLNISALLLKLIYKFPFIFVNLLLHLLQLLHMRFPQLLQWNYPFVIDRLHSLTQKIIAHGCSTGMTNFGKQTKMSWYVSCPNKIGSLTNQLFLFLM